MRWLLSPLRELWTDFLDLLFPPSRRCPLCGAAAEGGEVCHRCQEMISAYRLQVGCTCCGCFLGAAGSRDDPGRTSGGAHAAPVTAAAGPPGPTGRGGTPSPDLLCPHCRERYPPFSAARAVGLYEGLLKESILRLKFRRERWLARPLGRLLAAIAEEMVPAGTHPLVVPVPLSRKRLQARGFNQAECLARELSLSLGWPLLPVLRKVRETPPQTGLPRSARLSNLSGSFALAGDIPPGTVAVLVDDVITTGSTARECTRTLLAAGVVAVYVVTLAGPLCSRGSTEGDTGDPLF